MFDQPVQDVKMIFEYDPSFYVTLLYSHVPVLHPCNFEISLVYEGQFQPTWLCDPFIAGGTC